MWRVLLCIAFLLNVAFARGQSAKPETPLFSLPYSPSLDVSSMDRSVDPCVDFYRYSCGGWIKNNPIPPDQARWNVYSKLGDENQRFLWGILEQASSTTAGRRPVEKEIGDYFHACMDEAAVDKVGAAPLRTWLDEIAALTSIRQLPAFAARAQAAIFGDQMLFGIGSGQDYADSTRVIAFASAGGLGLPDRDYYTKTDAKSEEIRQRYLQHIQAMLQLLGEDAVLAKRHAQAVMEIETSLATASLTRVDLRDPHKIFHKMKRGQLQALTPSFRWSAYFAAARLNGAAEINVTEPAFFRQFQKLLETRSLDDWKAYLRWHIVHAKAPYLSAPFADANFDFYRSICAAWRRCRRDGSVACSRWIGIWARL